MPAPLYRPSVDYHFNDHTSFLELVTALIILTFFFNDFSPEDTSHINFQTKTLE